jgi:hypothetical protein
MPGVIAEEALLLPFDAQFKCFRLDGPNDLARLPMAHPFYEDKVIFVVHVIGCSFLACDLPGLVGYSNAIGGHRLVPHTMAEQARHCPAQSHLTALQLGGSFSI